MTYNYRFKFPPPCMHSFDENRDARKAHETSMDANLAVLFETERLKANFPFLWKVLSRKIRYLTQFHQYARTKFISFKAKSVALRDH